MRRLIVVGVAVFAITLGVMMYQRRAPAPPPQPGRGTPWTVLQDIEEQHRGDSAHEAPMLVSRPEGSRYAVLGLPTEDPGFPWAWILLNEHGVDRTADDVPPKMMPANARFHVECAYLDSLFAGTSVVPPADPSVQRLLKRHCGR
jgi:hypothetical protein